MAEEGQRESSDEGDGDEDGADEDPDDDLDFWYFSNYIRTN